MELFCDVVAVIFVIVALVCNVPMFQIIFMVLASCTIAVELIYWILNYFFGEE